MHPSSNLKDTQIWRAAPAGTDGDDCEAEAMIMFSARVSRVDFGRRMFRIEITADVADGPEGLPEKVGRLVAYRLHSPWVECAIEDGDMERYFDTFDAMSGDACSAIEDLIEVQGRVKKKLERALTYSPPDNLVYVDQLFVEKGFRGHGLARSMMAELHDFMAGAPALVFFQAIPFVSEVSAPSESRAWELERAAGTKAMARRWVGDCDLGFCQPGPRTHPHMIVGAWDGESLDPMAERCHFIPLEEVTPKPLSVDEAFGMPFPKAVSPAVKGRVAKGRRSQADVDPARMIDVYDLSEVERCRLATEDLENDIGFGNGKIEDIVSVGPTVYAAVREEDEVSAVVLSPKTGDGGLLYFRAIEEEMSPMACAAPLSLLGLLTAPRNDLAEAWRKECWRLAQEKRRSA